MIAYIFDTLRNNPELAIFLTLSLGYALGKVRLCLLYTSDAADDPTLV